MPKSMKKLVTKGAAVIKKTKIKKKPPRMTGDEKRLVREMHFERKMRPTDIAAAVGRDLSGICRLLAQKKAPKPMGRPRALTEGQIDKTIKTLEAMIDEASAKREVTLAMVMRRCRLKVCDRVVADALHARGYWFHKLRTKMILTPVWPCFAHRMQVVTALAIWGRSRKGLDHLAPALGVWWRAVNTS
jgi:hypothetical protein